MTITDNPVENGVNVQALLGAREALSATPEAADFTWRASCSWQNGTHSRSTVAGFTGLGAEQQHRVTYEFDVDHPECFASEDNGATPVEYILVGLAGNEQDRDRQLALRRIGHRPLAAARHRRHDRRTREQRMLETVPRGPFAP